MVRDSSSDWLIEHQWSVVCLSLKLESDGQTVIDEILLKYAEPHRAYHDSLHIAKMLRMLPFLDRCIADLGLEDMNQLVVAIIFHDVIYDPRAKDNEERSADFARNSLHDLGFDPLFIEKVIGYILCTKSHQADPDLPYCSVMIDADLAIFGAPQEEYAEYAASIRREYSFVSDDDFREAWKAVLMAFLQNPRIYLTNELEQELGLNARRNIQRELEQLLADS